MQLSLFGDVYKAIDFIGLIATIQSLLRKLIKIKAELVDEDELCKTIYSIIKYLNKSAITPADTYELADFINTRKSRKREVIKHLNL